MNLAFEAKRTRWGQSQLQSRMDELVGWKKVEIERVPDMFQRRLDRHGYEQRKGDPVHRDALLDKLPSAMTLMNAGGYLPEMGSKAIMPVTIIG